MDDEFLINQFKNKYLESRRLGSFGDHEEDDLDTPQSSFNDWMCPRCGVFMDCEEEECRLCQLPRF